MKNQEQMVNEARRVTKNAVENYGNKLIHYKEKQSKERFFHESLFEDIDDEIKKVDVLLKNLEMWFKESTNEVYGNAFRKGRNLQAIELMEKALDFYQKDIENLNEVSKKEFPNLEFKQATVTVGTINTIEEVLSRHKR
jgi:hypothetical protein